MIEEDVIRAIKAAPSNPVLPASCYIDESGEMRTTQSKCKEGTTNGKMSGNMEVKMIRNRIGGDQYPVQEVDGMHVVRIYASADDFTRFLKSKMSEEQRKEFEDCQWFPMRISIENDMTVDFTFMAIK